jgi:hypothetical protein
MPQLIRFMNNWSLTWARGRYEVRVWRHFPYRIDFMNRGPRCRTQ